MELNEETMDALGELAASSREIVPYWYPPVGGESPSAGVYLGNLIDEGVGRVLSFASGFLDDHDTEELHQLRINVRKLRALCQFTGPVAVDSEVLRGANGVLRALAVPFGEVRDRDVFLERLSAGELPADVLAAVSTKGREGVVERIVAERARFAGESEAVLRSSEWTDALGRIRRAASTGAWRGSVPGRLPARYVVAHGLDAAWWWLSAQLPCVADAGMAAGERHKVRIQAKKLRYITELTADLFDPLPAPLPDLLPDARPDSLTGAATGDRPSGGGHGDTLEQRRRAFTAACKDAQDVLGEIQDDLTAQRLLASA